MAGAIILIVLVFYFDFIPTGEKKYINEDDQSSQAVIDDDPVSIEKNSKKIEEANFVAIVPVILGSGPLVTATRNYIDEVIADFKKQADADVPDMREKFGDDSSMSNYSIDVGAKLGQSDETQSIILSVYAYSGGAHGNSLYKVFTASRPDGKTSVRMLILSDIIKNDQQNAFTEFLKKELKDWRPNISGGNSVIFADEVNNLKFSSLTSWSLQDDELIIYFDQYEIGPGTLGAVAFPLPLEKVKVFMSENYF